MGGFLYVTLSISCVFFFIHILHFYFDKCIVSSEVYQNYSCITSLIEQT